MPKKRIEHLAKVPADKQPEVVRYVLENDANAVRLKCCEQRYQTAVLAGDDETAIKEHRKKIELNRVTRKSQSRVWSFIRTILPEVPEPTKETEHTIDIVGECDIKWYTYEDVVLTQESPAPHREATAPLASQAPQPAKA